MIRISHDTLSFRLQTYHLKHTLMSAFKLLICSVCIGPLITMPVTWPAPPPVEGTVLGMVQV